MKLHGLFSSGYCPLDKKVHIYSNYKDASAFSFMKRGAIKESMKFIARESHLGLQKGKRYSVINDDMVVHIYASPMPDLSFYAFVDVDYPKRVAFKALEEFEALFQS
jgi:synaptobrevin family protein YKT6